MSDRSINEVFDKVTTIKEKDIPDLVEEIHKLDKKLVEQNHIKKDIGKLNASIEKINKRCKHNHLSPDGGYFLLSNRVDEHAKYIKVTEGKSKGRASIEAAFRHWLPAIIALAALILNYIANGSAS